MGSITTANAGSNVAGLTPGSFVSSSVPANAYSASFAISQRYSGQLAVFISPDGVNLIQVPFTQVLGPGGVPGLPANAKGMFTVAVGSGTIYVVAMSLSSGAPQVSFNFALPSTSSNSFSVGGQAISASNPIPTAMAGATLTPVPSSWAQGTNWNTQNGLPSGVKAIWVQVNPGTTCTIQIDGGGATAFQFQMVQTGWLIVPPGLNVTNIYSPANGSAGASIAGVIS